MAKQYNMYNVQLSEFWKQRVSKEALHNAPYPVEEDDDMASVVSHGSSVSRVSHRAASEVSRVSRVSVASESSARKVRRQHPVVARARRPSMRLLGRRGRCDG